MSVVNASTPDLVKYPNRLFIGGKWQPPEDGSSIDVINPSNGRVLVSVAEAKEADINHAVASAREAFDHGPWPRMTHLERAQYLREIGRAIVSRSSHLSDIWSSEVGVIRAFAGVITPTNAQTYEYYADLAATFPFEERHQPQIGHTGLLVREPVGVVAAIIPWNGPLGLIANKLAPALLSGCTVVLKMSPEAPASGYVMAEICEAVGLPPGVVNVITADREASEVLVRHAGVDKVAFTGSTAVGKRIAAICADRVARVTLELGGKSAAVILDDCDLEQAAESISQSARLLTGQVCSSLTRLIVTKRQHDRFVDALSASMNRIRVGDPFDPESHMGPLAMERQRDRVEHYIAKGREEGAKLTAGGHRPKHLSQGYFIEPTVFANVDNRMTIAREEIFGPVLSVLPAKSEEDAIEIANNSIYGLNASVFTKDAGRAYEVARRLRSGTVGHNGFRSDFSIAFGGFKQSGIGREGGTEGLRPYLEIKTIILDADPSPTH